ncbi:choice-of-anchor A family protein [Kitasatospora sp. DSM 101779]|uniref:choice-of-anchor A family protein n=1 Tax=Kitasatospora sp. DSM 101779 TaxID=2853165 RepID=UPI0021DA7D65|nr:choice-of-anchor A family protein [Kitasatospora sp. DSM 101779]MCU7822396.1 choice-of-anchor A family protein [Kitasatospora sp. DSM 101779]
MRISRPAAALALGGSLALGALSAPAAHAAPVGGSCRSLGTANLYGEFVEGDDTHSPDAEGAVAVGGNADFRGGFSVGNELADAQVAALPGGNALVVAGGITGSVQVMKGNGVYGGTLAGTAEAHRGKVVHGASPIDFAAEFAKLRAVSAELAARTTPGTAIKAAGDTLTLTGTDPGLNAFVLTAAQLQGAKEVYLHVPTGAVTVVSVTGDGYDQAAAHTTGFFLWDAGTRKYVLDDKTQSAAGGAVRARLLWNFPTAAKVVKNSGNAWPGSVLAPNAAVDLGSGGPVNGSVIAKSLKGSGGAETHHYPFEGCLPGTDTPRPTPSGSTPPATTGGSTGTTGTTGTTTVGGTSTGGTTTGGGSPSPTPSGSTPATPPASGGGTTGGGLAFTGADGVIPLAVGGVLVLAAGGGIVLAVRRRRA